MSIEACCVLSFHQYAMLKKRINERLISVAAVPGFAAVVVIGSEEDLLESGCMLSQFDSAQQLAVVRAPLKVVSFEDNATVTKDATDDDLHTMRKEFIPSDFK